MERPMRAKPPVPSLKSLLMPILLIFKKEQAADAQSIRSFSVFLYSVFLKIDITLGFKYDPLVLQTLSLGRTAAEGIVLRHLAPAVHHPVARILRRVRVIVKDVAHNS